METWTAIPGFEGLYEASSEGTIRSLERRVPRINHGTFVMSLVPSTVLSPDIGKWDYCRVTLFKEGVRHRHLVHHLVLSAFVGPCPAGYETNHRNGIRSDNRIANLEWVTRRANLRHSFDQLGRRSRGRALPGARNSRAKAIDVERVFSLRADGLSQQAIAAIVGCHQTMVSYVLQGRHWSQCST